MKTSNTSLSARAARVRAAALPPRVHARPIVVTALPAAVPQRVVDPPSAPISIISRPDGSFEIIGG